MPRAVLLWLGLMAALAGATISAAAQPADNFYKNRQVRLVIGAESPDLEGQAMSNALEVEVDTRAVVTGR